GLLLDGNRRRQAVDQIDVRLLHLLEELSGVGGERLDIASLPFRVNRVEGQRRLSRSGQARDHHQLLPGDVDVDVFQIVNARAAYSDPVVGHANRPFYHFDWSKLSGSDLSPYRTLSLRRRALAAASMPASSSSASVCAPRAGAGRTAASGDAM